MNQPDEDDSPPLASICDAQLQPSTVSILTEPPDVVPLTTLPRSSPCSIGQPQTPPSRVLIMPSEELMEAGYDTDHQCGPFVQNGVKDEEFYNMDEAAPEAPIEVVPVLGGGTGMWLWLK